jgi:hypothetical protein
VVHLSMMLTSVFIPGNDFVHTLTLIARAACFNRPLI